MKKAFTKALLTVATLLMITAVNTNGSNFTRNLNSVSNEAGEQREELYCGVAGGEIVYYLQQFGYIVKSIDSQTGSCDVIVTTQYSYRTIVHIDPTVGITGHEDIQI